MKLVEKSKGVFHLVEDDIEKSCPFQPGIPIQEQTPMGQPVLNIVRTPCTSSCALFEFYPETGGNAKVLLRCSPDHIEFVTKMERLQEKKKGLFLTKGEA